MAPRKKQVADVRTEAEEQVWRYATSSESLPVSDDGVPDFPEAETPDDRPVFTANQVVAYNLQRIRKAQGWTQEFLGDHLEQVTGRVWSKASVSAAESSWRGGRVRRFDANELMAFAYIFNVPVSEFFEPPATADMAEALFVADVLGEVGIPTLSRETFGCLAKTPVKKQEQAAQPEAVPTLTPQAISAVLDAMKAEGLVYNPEKSGR